MTWCPTAINTDLIFFLSMWPDLFKSNAWKASLAATLDEMPKSATISFSSISLSKSSSVRPCFVIAKSLAYLTYLAPGTGGLKPADSLLSSNFFAFCVVRAILFYSVLALES